MKPILFNTEMVRAILDGRKTVTRRAVKPQPEARLVPGEKDCYIYRGIPCGLDGMTNFAPYRPGDILYVRETWANLLYPDGHTRYVYKATDTYPFGEKMVLQFRWHPSIHMPWEAARIFLRVTDVRVERLQDITPEQIDAEGCKEWAYSAKTGELLPSGPSCFRIAWDKTIKPEDRALYSWDANPWVWVIEFERCGKPEERKMI